MVKKGGRMMLKKKPMIDFTGFYLSVELQLSCERRRPRMDLSPSLQGN